MRVKDYLNKIGGSTDVTFIKARARKDSNTPGYHAEYQTTPIRMAYEWLDPNWNNKKLLNSIILNDKQPPIEWISGAKWSNDFNSGHLKSLLVISEEDMELLIPWKEQRDSMEEYIEKRITTLL